MLISILTLFLNPIYAPAKVNGTETPNHKANKAIKVENGTAPELPLLHRMRFIMKNKPKTILREKTNNFFKFEKWLYKIFYRIQVFF